MYHFRSLAHDLQVAGRPRNQIKEGEYLAVVSKAGTKRLLLYITDLLI